MSGGDWKAMFKAIQENDVTLVKYYLRLNIDPNYQHPEFLALPLSESIRYNHLEIAELLLQNGAKPSIKEMESGVTTLELAKKLGNREGVELLEKFIVAKTSSNKPKMPHHLITGANTGIGKATATAIAKQGNKVIIACRNETKAAQAVTEIKAASKSEEVYGLVCDLASFESVRNCAAAYRKQFGQLDVLINNAGLIADKLQFTKDGYELQIGVNHLGHFLLTTQLLDLLQQSPEPRVVNVSSEAHKGGKIHFDFFKGEVGAKKYKGMAAYSQSKMANILFTKELARRYPSICCHSLHPGVVSTGIAGKNDNKALWKFAWKLFSPLMLTPAKGAKTSVYLATSPEALKTNGKYFVKEKEKVPDDLANDVALAKKLWELSEELVG